MADDRSAVPTLTGQAGKRVKKLEKRASKLAKRARKAWKKARKARKKHERRKHAERAKPKAVV